MELLRKQLSRKEKRWTFTRPPKTENCVASEFLEIIGIVVQSFMEAEMENDTVASQVHQTIHSVSSQPSKQDEFTAPESDKVSTKMFAI